jgi:hypothetical protein
MAGLPLILIMHLLEMEESSSSRLPLPPAKINAFINAAFQ